MPDEVKLLPCEPTPEMASAGMHIISALPEEAGWPQLARAACDVYRAMVKAATRPPIGTDEVVEMLGEARWLFAQIAQMHSTDHGDPLERCMELARKGYELTKPAIASD